MMSLIETVESETELQQEAKDKKKKRPVAILLMGAALLTAIVYGYKLWSFGQSHVSTDDAQVASTILQLAPKVPGTVEKVFVKDNQVVKRGDLIAQIDPSTYEAAVLQ